MKTLWVFGCSFTKPYFEWLNHDGTESNYNRYKKYHGGVFPKTWSELLSERLECELQNHSCGGASNYEILQRFCGVCREIKENDIVIIQWTHVERYQYGEGPNLVNLSGPWSFKSAGELSEITATEVYLNRSESYGFVTEIYNYMNLLDRFSELGKFKIYYWSACDKIINGESEDFKKQDKFLINESNEGLIHYLEKKYKNTPLTIINETNKMINDLHYGIHGHKLLCDLFYEELSKKIL